MKRILKRVSYIYHNLPVRVLKMIYKNKKNRMNDSVNQTMISMCKIAENNTDIFYSYRMRPKMSVNIPVVVQNNKYDKCAIVMQGPIRTADNFTYETIKLYRKFYPNCLLILSTWENEQLDYINKIEKEGVIVVQSKKPEYRGHGNINYQLVSTKAGIYKAKELGAEYICKTRTDQRLYHSNVVEYMINLINTFPCSNEDVKIGQMGRIVCFGMEYGDLFYPFFLSDFFYFGKTVDLCCLFNCKLDFRSNVPAVKGNTRKECADRRLVTEIQIMMQYAERIGYNVEPTVKSYWQFVRNHLICINKDEIGLYWPKYNSRYVENIRNGLYYDDEPIYMFKCYNWDFINWLNLYTGTLKYDEEYEKYTDISV